MIDRRAMIAGGLDIGGLATACRARRRKAVSVWGTAGRRLRYRDARGVARQKAADQAVLSSAKL